MEVEAGKLDSEEPLTPIISRSYDGPVRELKAFCFVDSRRSPEFYSFQRTALMRALKPRFSKIEFLALVQNPADRIHVENEDAVLVSAELESLAELLAELQNRADGADWIIFTEPNVYPDVKWADSLAEKPPNSSVVSHPAYSLTLALDKQILFLNQSSRAADSDWVTSLRFCFATAPANLLRVKVDLRRYAIGDLRESFVHIFRSQGLDFEAARNTAVHVVLSWVVPPEGPERKAAFFSPPARPKGKRLGFGLDEWKKVAESMQVDGKTLPDSIKADIRELGKFDLRWSRISPIEESIELRKPFHPEELLLRTICAAVPRVDYVVVLHQLRRGGSEKEGILHVNAYRELFPSQKIGVILTSPIEPDLEWQLPKDVSVIELGKELTALQLDPVAKSYFLYRLLDQLDPHTIHVKGSDVGWRALMTYGPALAKKSKLIANLYCVDYSQDGASMSFGFNELPLAARSLTWLLADNQNVLDQMRAMVRVPTRKVAYPVELPKKKWSAPEKNDPFRVLWCSRLTFQKSINQLLLAASFFKEYEFHVYGEQSDDLPYISAFNQLPNVKYWGLFDSIEEVDLSRFHCFLYTSFWDGLPNILLEAGAYGMPIVSPRVGGIGEILNERNSYLYDSGTDLLRILSFWPDAQAEETGRRLRDDIAKGHTWDRFLEECRVIYGS